MKNFLGPAWFFLPTNNKAQIRSKNDLKERFYALFHMYPSDVTVLPTMAKQLCPEEVPVCPKETITEEALQQLQERCHAVEENLKQEKSAIAKLLDECKQKAVTDRELFEKQCSQEKERLEKNLQAQFAENLEPIKSGYNRIT